MSEFNTPWNVYRINSIRGSIIDSECSTVTNRVDPERAAHIVLCVNSHDALVDALTIARNRMLDMMRQDDGQAYKDAERAIPQIEKALAAAGVKL